MPEPTNPFADDLFLKERVLFMEGPFDEVNTNRLRRQIIYCLTHEEEKPIQLYISSFGGSGHDCLALIDLLESRKCKLTTIATGRCQSAGAYLFLTGDVRIQYENTPIMFHEVAGATNYQKLHDHEADIEEERELMRRILVHTKRKTKIQNPEEKFKRDYYVWADQAIRLNVSTKIIKNKRIMK